MVVAVGIGVGVGVRVGVGVVQQIQVFQAAKTVPGESSVGHFLMHWSPRSSNGSNASSRLRPEAEKRCHGSSCSILERRAQNDQTIFSSE